MKQAEQIENEIEVLDELLEHEEILRERERNRIGVRTMNDNFHEKCPRCQAKVKISSRHPYCPDCNWDSLTDPSNIRLK